MAYTTINKSSDYFNSTIYTGNGTARTITVGLQPDLVWTKSRSAGHHGIITDATTGAGKRLRTSVTSAQDVSGASVASFVSTGYTLTDNSTINGNSETNVSWSWKGGGGQGSSNTDGSINTTYTSANTTSGVSIVSYTGTGSAATIGHGLGTVPKVIISKKLNDTSSWMVYHASLGNNKEMYLNATDASSNASATWNSTTPTSSVWSVSNDANNTSGSTYVSYVFAEKTGFSKFGSYTGNANANGTFIYTGFKPAFVLIKQSSAAGEDWNIYDNKRLGYNATDKALFANLSNAEATKTGGMDFLSNGIKMRGTDGSFNTSQTYIYMAFAEAPLVGSNNVPCTAR